MAKEIETALRTVRQLVPGAHRKETQNGVPVVVLGTRSVAFFYSTKQYRGFTNHGVRGAVQEKFTFDRPEQAALFLLGEVAMQELLMWHKQAKQTREEKAA